MLSSNMKKKAFELQQHTATKKLFKAVNEGKSILVYGPLEAAKRNLWAEMRFYLTNTLLHT